MPQNGILHKNKSTLEGKWVEIRRKRMELEKSRRALLTQIQMAKLKKTKAEQTRQQKEQLEIAKSAFRKLLIGKQRGKDPYETPGFSSPSAAEQIVKVINMRRNSATKRDNLSIEFEKYMPWGTEISSVNTHLPKEMKLTRNEVLLLFLNWDKIRKAFGKTHPEMFTVEKQNFTSQPTVEQRTYNIDVRKRGSGPFATISTGQNTAVPSNKLRTEKPKTPLTPAQLVRKQIHKQQQEKPALSRKQKRRAQMEAKKGKRNKRK